MVVFNEADTNHDGGVDKNELLGVCKRIFNKSPYQGTVTSYIAPPPTYTYTYYVQRPVTYSIPVSTCYKTTTTTYY